MLSYNLFEGDFIFFLENKVLGVFFFIFRGLLFFFRVFVSIWVNRGVYVLVFRRGGAWRVLDRFFEYFCSVCFMSLFFIFF